MITHTSGSRQFAYINFAKQLPLLGASPPPPTHTRYRKWFYSIAIVQVWYTRDRRKVAASDFAYQAHPLFSVNIEKLGKGLRTRLVNSAIIHIALALSLFLSLSPLT